MSELRWTRDFATGLAEIDQQHQRLFHVFDVLRQSIDRGVGGDQLSVIFMEMVSYVWRHLRYEEKLLRKNGYPGLEEHKACHNRLEMELNTLHDAYDAVSLDNRGPVAHRVADFLEKWLVEHINVEDRNYAVYLKQQGIIR